MEKIEDEVDFNKALQNAEELIDREEYGKAKRVLAPLWEARDRADEAIRLDLSLAYARCLGCLGEHADSLRASKEASKLADKHSPEKRKALSCLKFQGNSLMQLDNFGEALRLFREALHIARRDGLIDECAGLYNNLGIIHQRLGEYEEAIRYYRLATEFYEKEEPRDSVTIAKINTASCLYYLDRIDEAEPIFEEISTQNSKGNLDNALIAKVGKAMVLAVKRDFEASECLFHEVIGTLIAQEKRDWAAEALLDHGEVLVKTDQLHKAEKVLRESIALSRELGMRRFEIKGRLRLVEVLERQERLAEAYSELKLTRELEADLHSAVAENQTLSYRILHETERAQHLVELREARGQELARALEESDKQKAYADEANRLKSEILRMAAHDLRNPLGGVIGLLEQYDSFSPEEQPSILESAVGEARHALDLLEHLLDASAIEEGSVRLDLGNHDFIEILDKVLAGSLSRMITDKGQILRGHKHGEPLPVRVDSRRCSQILRNLFSNASKYSPHGGEIRFGTEKEEGCLLFRVEDDGPGIPPEDLESVFKPFHRLPSSIPTGGESTTGLGLSIARNLARQHGGELWAESDGPGKGSRFFLRLPLLAAV